MSKQSPVGVDGLVLADIPERQRLRDLQADLEARRDTIAAMDLEIETLREQLGTFEAEYHGRLRSEHDRIRRVQSWVQHVERWVETLQARHAAAQAVPDPLFERQTERLETRRAQELKQQKVASEQVRRAEAAATSQREAAAARPADLKEQLKSAYRELARRFHPDLARTEEERLHHSQVMTRINALYRAGDVERLTAMREQARGAELDTADLTLEEQLQQLTQRRDWFDTVVKNLQEERAALEQSATCELMRNVEQATLQGRNLVEELRGQLQERIVRLYNDVTYAAHSLENAVSRHNRNLTQNRPGEALEVYFDPYEDKRMVRLGLEALAQQHVTKAMRERAAGLEDMAQSKPAVLRLLLFTYVAELSPLPLVGLEKYDDLTLRFAALGQDDPEVLTLEQTLIEADQWVEYGVRQATATLAHAGLRLRQTDLKEAIEVALQALPVRREFKRVLGVLGEHTQCQGCASEVFAVPLYRTRGLDDLRASVCPRCGATLRSYWMPKGKDVQAVLNSAFLDFEIVSEFSFSLGKASIAMQLVPHQVETLTVGELKTRVVHDVFSRYELAIADADVELHQGDKRIADKTRLDRIDPPRFVVRFSQGAEISENDALELIRHRIRNRFSQ